jgi:uncharacterized protein (DUF849 family)
VIQAALNGGRTRAEHPAIPITPEELAASAQESVAAGAASIHFHVRGADGRESLEPDDVARALTAARSAIPGVPIGVSTGAWIVRDATLRHETVSRWKVLPDFASVNFKEDGAVALAELLLSRGVGIEVGLSDLSGSQVFVNNGLNLSDRSESAQASLRLGLGVDLSALAPKGFASKCLRILMEPFELSVEGARETVQQIVEVLDPWQIKLPRLLHGLNRTAWELIDEAAARGYDTRVGFEDILILPDGSRAPSNGALVAEAVRRLRQTPPR